MILFSSALTKHKLLFNKLSTCLEFLPTAAQWVEDEWGYIRNRGVEERKVLLNEISGNIYIGTLNGQPVAMFALFNHHFHEDMTEAFEHLPKMKELMYVYIEKDYRGLGFGRQIIDTAKRLAKLAGDELILLDTLKPGLNRMYEK